jgi:hypothetical protein
MKKLISLSMMILISTASLHAHGGSHGYYIGHGGWIFPFVLGGILGSTVTRQNVVYDQRPTVIYTSPPRTVIRETIPSTYIQQSYDDGLDSPVYEERWVYFEDCQCERKVLINTQY